MPYGMNNIAEYLREYIYIADICGVGTPNFKLMGLLRVRVTFRASNDLRTTVTAEAGRCCGCMDSGHNREVRSSNNEQWELLKAYELKVCSKQNHNTVKTKVSFVGTQQRRSKLEYRRVGTAQGIFVCSKQNHNARKAKPFPAAQSRHTNGVQARSLQNVRSRT